MRTSQASFTTAAALALFATACGPSPSTSPAPVASANATTRPRAIPVQVNNQNFNTMDVYVIREGGRWLVGQVDGLSDTTLTIPVASHRFVSGKGNVADRYQCAGIDE